MSNEIHAPSRHDEFLLLLIPLLGFFPSLQPLLSPLVRPMSANSPNARDTEPVCQRIPDDLCVAGPRGRILHRLSWRFSLPLASPRG